jgi:hypothetical protein
MVSEEFKKQLAGDKFAGYKKIAKEVGKATYNGGKVLEKVGSKGINKAGIVTRKLYNKYASQRMTNKRVLKKNNMQVHISDYKQPTSTKFSFQTSPNANIKIGKGTGSFEAFTFKSGKPLSLGKFESKGKASKKLKSTLIETLSASGFIEETLGIGKTAKKKKLLAEETGLLSDFGFRKSKTGNKFLVVEEKPLRLRKGGTGKQIQYFR